jgi:hypothetical protein
MNVNQKRGRGESAREEECELEHREGRKWEEECELEDREERKWEEECEWENSEKRNVN